MDVTPYLEIAPAPRAVFDRLSEQPEWSERARFFVPDREGWRPVTWGRFAALIRNAALHLAGLGFKPGDRAAILADSSVEWAAAALAIQSAGGTMVPIYPASTAEQIAYVVSHSGARVLYVAGDALAARAERARAGCPGLEHRVRLDGDDWHQAQIAGEAAHIADPDAFRRRLDAVENDQVGLMLYTSGTSGNPKGVPLTHANVGENSLDWLTCNAPLLHQDAVDILWLPMSHIFGFGELCLGNTLGFTTYLASPRDVLERMPEIAPTVFFSVPAYWEKLARGAMGEGDPERRVEAIAAATGGRLRFCLSGGAGLKREIKELFYSAGVLIIEGYGLTECAPTLTLNRPRDFRFDSVGKPLPRVELRLADDGEILARGPNVFAGYHDDPEATAAAFTADGWFKTGDVGRFTDDGFLQIIDRKKDILVTAGGKNVPPANIELRFKDDPIIEHLVVYGDGHKYLVAAVWPNRAAAAGGDLRALVEQRIAAVNATLARHETIKRFCIIDEPLTVENGLLTSSLKLRRKHVYQAFRDRFEALYAEAAPAAREAAR
jgi:long-chain acyl-CoA synthetase